MVSRNFVVTEQIRISGMSTVEVVVRHDGHGAAVWEIRNVDTFALKGDPAKTQKAIGKVFSEFCKGPSRMVGGGTSGGVFRVKEGVLTANGTVVGGAATTLGAAALMLPCQLTFFYKLGLLIFTTIFCSLVFAFGFVMPLLAAAGPSGDWCGFSLPGQKRHHGGRVAPDAATPSP